MREDIYIYIHFFFFNFSMATCGVCVISFELK
jgi:hypothetical protein